MTLTRSPAWIELVAVRMRLQALYALFGGALAAFNISLAVLAWTLCGCP